MVDLLNIEYEQGGIIYLMFLIEVFDFFTLSIYIHTGQPEFAGSILPAVKQMISDITSGYYRHTDTEVCNCIELGNIYLEYLMRIFAASVLMRTVRADTNH